MRVAIIIDTLNIGGAQKLITSFVSAVPKQSIQPTVVSLRDHAAPVNLASIHSADVDVRIFPSHSLLNLGRLRQLIHFLRAEKFDLIHTHLSYANILGCLAGYYAGIPVIATLHSTGHDSYRKSGLLIRLEGVILRYFARRIALSRCGAKSMRNSRRARNSVSHLLWSCVTDLEMVDWQP